jgi:GR25 family glycosyltransferase involved in LPS biosynthesis
MDGIPKFVINLKRRQDRLEAFRKRCPFNDVFLVPGFDAQNYSDEQSEDIAFFNKVTCKLPGERAVYVSHLRVFKEIIENNFAYGLIFEDDAIFCKDFLTRFHEVINEIPDDTHILYIGGRFTKLYRMRAENCLKVTTNIVKHSTGTGLCRGWDIDRTAHAYIISNTGAKKFLDYCNSMETIERPIDDLILHFFLENKIPVYNSMPLLCHSPLVGDSDIR